jgi:hypothetical protein
MEGRGIVTAEPGLVGAAQVLFATVPRKRAPAAKRR